MNLQFGSAIEVLKAVRARVDVFEACVAKLKLSRTYDVKSRTDTFQNGAPIETSG